VTAPDAPRPNGGGAPSRVRVAAAAALLVTFAAGAALGVGVERWRAHQRFEQHGGGGRSGRGGGPMGDGFLRTLHLTTAQRASVDSILERRRVQLEQFWSGPGQQLRTIVDSTRNEIRAVLTPAQRTTYDSMMTERRQRERAREMGGGPIGPPPLGSRRD
jgi:Spy/CpxP family protein refolding chaperone